jgi:S1-C subfamily serine protease
VRRAAIGGVACLAVVATALAWPQARPAMPPITHVLAVSVKPPSGPTLVASGFVAGRGRAVTVAHLVERGSKIVVRRPGGRARRARLLRLDRRTDLALLAVPGLRGRPLRTAGAPEDVRLLVLRDQRAVRRPARVRRTVRAHVRAAPGARPHIRPALELAARIAPGDSGAPVVTAEGELAGALFARSREDPRTAYAVDASAVAALMRRGRVGDGREPPNDPG